MLAVFLCFAPFLRHCLVYMQSVMYIQSVVCLLCIQDDGEDFEHLNDEDEFEGFDKERTPKKSHEQPPDLKITKVCTA